MEISSLLFALVLCNGHMFTMAEPLEPSCSKFDYEIRTLEAMLRTEHKVEKMLEEMKALREASLEDLGESKTFREVTKTEIGELKAEMDKTMIEKDGDVGEKLETITRKTGEKLQAIEAALEQIASKLAESTVASLGKHNVYGWLRLNNENKVFAGSFNDNSYTTASASVFLMLSKGDRVNPGSCSGWKNVYGVNYGTTFSGTLLKQANVD